MNLKRATSAAKKLRLTTLMLFQPTHFCGVLKRGYRAGKHARETVAVYGKTTKNKNRIKKLEQIFVQTRPRNEVFDTKTYTVHALKTKTREELLGRGNVALK